MKRLLITAIFATTFLSSGSVLAEWQSDFTHDGLSASGGALVVYHDSVVVGGWFAAASGNPVNCIARWNGSEWVSLDGGMLGPSPRVLAMTIYGDKLIAAGFFARAGSVPVNNIAQWDGRGWAPLGAGTNGIVTALTVFEGDLVVGGAFSSAGGAPATSIARWNGTNWSAMGTGREEQVLALAELDGTLYAGSFFDWEHPEPLNSIGAWDGGAWHSVGDGLPFAVLSLCAYAEPWSTRERLLAGGFHDYLSRWDGTAWTDYGDRLQGTTYGDFEMVFAMARAGNDLYVTGHFLNAGAATCNHIARWDGQEYHPLDIGLYLGSGPDADAFGSSLLVTGGEVYVAGTFSTTGHTRSACIGKWDPAAAAAATPDLALRAFPIPANPKVTLSYRLEEAARVQLRIFDVRGRCVATAQDEVVSAGAHTASWDGQDDDARPLPSGVYVAVLAAGAQREATRFVLAR